MYAFDIQLQLLGKKRENIVASNFERKENQEIIVRKERKNDEEEELKIIMLGF